MLRSKVHSRRTVLSALAGGSLAGVTSATEQGVKSLRRTGIQEDGIEQVIDETYGDPGLVTDVSNSGEWVLFGLSTGDIVSYGGARDSDLLPVDAGSAVSHIQVEDEIDTAALAWMDGYLYGPMELPAGTGPLYEHPGIWDIAMVPDEQLIASVSHPTEGIGSVGLTSEDGIEWESPLENASALSVDITDDGNHIAVGGAHYWVDALDRTGTPGIMLYDDEGERQWLHETEEDVLSAHVDADRELVVAGTDDRQIIVLDFDGEIVWETDEYGSWVKLSGDGSTVVSAEIDDTVQALDAETGDEVWTAEIGGWADEDVSVSNDGDRAIAADRINGEVHVVEAEGVLWEESYDVGPAIGALSGDGETWSVMVQNNVDETAHVEIYEENR